MPLSTFRVRKTFFVRIINCQAGELKAGDQVKLAVFDVDPVPQDMGREVVEIPPRLLCL